MPNCRNSKGNYAPMYNASYHLLRHARTFRTLVNTEVGTKEMIHRIFKNMIPRTNCKNIEFDLLKRCEPTNEP